MLETTRLILRPMQADDFPALLRIFRDPQVMAAFGGVLFDDVQMERWLQHNLDHQDEHGYGLFAVILKANGELIGDCGLTHMHLDAQPEVELGYDFLSDYWNQGLATEAALAVRDYALQTLGLPRLISLIRHGNHPSRRVAEKVGMSLSATITRYGRDYWLYALNREAPIE